MALGLLGQFQIIVSDHILEALRRTLEKPYFAERLTEAQRRGNLDAVWQLSEPCDPDLSVQGVCDDGEDDLVLGTAVAANADFLVTGDKGLLRIAEYRGVRIVSATTFLDVLHGPAGGTG